MFCQKIHKHENDTSLVFFEFMCLMTKHVLCPKTHEHQKYTWCVILVFMCFRTKRITSKKTCDMKKNQKIHVTCFQRFHVCWGEIYKHEKNMPCGKSVHVYFHVTCEHQKNMSYVKNLFMCFHPTSMVESVCEKHVLRNKWHEHQKHTWHGAIWRYSVYVAWTWSSCGFSYTT